jgi:hypothetical protein
VPDDGHKPKFGKPDLPTLKPDVAVDKVSGVAFAAIIFGFKLREFGPFFEEVFEGGFNMQLGIAQGKAVNFFQPGTALLVPRRRKGLIFASFGISLLLITQNGIVHKTDTSEGFSKQCFLIF